MASRGEFRDWLVVAGWKCLEFREKESEGTGSNAGAIQPSWRNGVRRGAKIRVRPSLPGLRGASDRPSPGVSFAPTRASTGIRAGPPSLVDARPRTLRALWIECVPRLRTAPSANSSRPNRRGEGPDRGDLVEVPRRCENVRARVPPGASTRRPAKPRRWLGAPLSCRRGGSPGSDPVASPRCYDPAARIGGPTAGALRAPARADAVLLNRDPYLNSPVLALRVLEISSSMTQGRLAAPNLAEPRRSVYRSLARVRSECRNHSRRER